ncbi:hypothetical protein RhiJN_25429 [Ceratobasidium sp. AG-Ba]|nr:hypothetical protein RhiJN_25429 [Ceratobasidium sp. AG-Ba]
MFQLPQTSEGLEGGCDMKPLPLPDISAEQFRNLLYIFCESPVDPGFLAFVSGAANKQNHSSEAFRRYLDIASLARRYLMQEVEAWAYAQLDVIASTIAFSERVPIAQLRDALDYAKIRSGDSNDDEFMRNIRNSAACAMCNTSRSGYCLEVYRKKVFDRFLYGLSYICVLSLGYESKEWRALTREDRAILYASQVRLSPVPSFLSLQPLLYTTILRESADKDGNVSSLCLGISTTLTSTWSSGPAEGLMKIRDLPLRRRRLAKAFETSPCQCSKRCDKKLLSKIDWLMEIFLNDLCAFRDALIQ